MKKIVSDFIKSLGCETSYSGNEKRMFIKGKNANEVEMKVLKKFGYGLPFGLSS